MSETLTGIVAGIILTLGTDMVLHAIGGFPRWGQPMAGAFLLLATAYRTVNGVSGSHIAARLAPDWPFHDQSTRSSCQSYLKRLFQL